MQDSVCVVEDNRPAACWGCVRRTSNLERDHAPIGVAAEAATLLFKVLADHVTPSLCVRRR